MFCAAQNIMEILVLELFGDTALSCFCIWSDLSSLVFW